MEQLSKQDIAKLVKDGRMAKALTQQELADMAGISLRSVQRIESAEVLPRMFTLKLLVDRLNFSEVLISEHVENAPTSGKTLVVQRKLLNKPQQIILTIGGGLLLVLFVGAFLSQKANFPETTFELFAFLFVVVGVYGSVLFRIWK